MIASYPSSVRVFCIDTDDSLYDSEAYKGAKVVRSPAEAKFWINFHNKIRYVPRREYKTRDEWDRLFDWLSSLSSKKKPKPMIIHINEIYRLGYGTNFPISIAETMATARKQKISMFIETQRPKAIPLLVLTEASRIFVWVLTREDDRKYIAGYTGGGKQKDFLSILNEQKLDFSFIEINTDDSTWEKYPPILL